MPRPHIFISYTRADSDLMRRIRIDLEVRGIMTWDDENLKPGTPNWRNAVAAAIRRSGGVVVILSPDSNHSQWVAEELNYAQTHSVRVFPVLARGDERVSVPFGFSAAQWVDVRSEDLYTSQIDHLVDTIDEHLNTLPYRPDTVEMQISPQDGGETLGIASRIRLVRVVGALGGVGIVLAGVLALAGVFARPGDESEIPEPALAEDTPAATEELESLPTEIEQPAPTDEPQPIATSTPGPEEIALAGVSSNAEWIPYIQTFGGIEMALVPTGCFTMGSLDGFVSEQPIGDICFEQPFWIDVVEVTNQQFRSVGCFGGVDNPRNCINWFDATAHCESREARLPTEAEWEYAARGPDGLVYPWGDVFAGDNLVYTQNAGGKTAPVGSRPEGASWVGAYDMAGNVWEWTRSLFFDYPYDAGDGREDITPELETFPRVLRGGSWGSEDSNIIRSANRLSASPDVAFDSYGFRCVRSY